MAFPTVAGTDSGSLAAETTPDIDLTGTGTVAAGDLLVMMLSANGAPTHTWGGGATKFVTETGTGSTLSCGYLIAAGGETTITVTLSTSQDSSFYAARIQAGTWHGTTPPAAATVTTGTSTAPNSGSLNPAAWDVEDTLWFSVCAVDNNVTLLTGFPASYTDTAEVVNPGRILGVCRRNNAVAAEDPGAFTLSASTAWKAVTIGVRPAAATASLIYNPFRQASSLYKR